MRSVSTNDCQELRECPFCGVTGVILSDRWREWALFEHKDSCLFPNFRKHEIPASDFAAWNTRAERTCRITSEEYDDLLDMFTTNFSCGHYGIGMARWFKHCPECGAKVVD